MGFFKKIINKFKKKPNLEKELIKQNQAEADKVLVNVASQKKFNDSLKKSASAFAEFINDVTANLKEVDQKFIDDLEETLVSFDFGPVLADKLTQEIVDEIKYHNVKDPKLIKEIILDKIFVNYIQSGSINSSLNLKPNHTNIVLIMGANGVGKTTSIGKIAKMLKDQNKKVLLVAADTFRAGAIEQLKVWADRLGVEIIAPKKYGADPASVIYEGLSYGQKNQFDVVICDTSGRLENKANLMAELAKLDKTIKKFDPTAPHESLLVLDATIGQSGLSQASVFNDSSKISGIILTKMDSTSKGGIIFAIKESLNIPVKYIGLGEKLDDLSAFDLERVVDSITQNMDL